LDGVERVDGKIQSGVKPPQSKKQGSGLNFGKMITFAPSRLRVRRFPLPRCSRLEAGGRAAHLFFDPPDTSAAAFKTIQQFFNGGG
jgi:hypothetical protein